jgi:cell division protein FtsB
MSVIWQQQTHGVLKRQQTANRFIAKLLLGVVLIVTVLAATYLALVASNVSIARQVWAMENELSGIQRENHAIRTEAARLSSIPMMQVRSVDLNYQPAASVEYVYLGAP